MYYVYILKSRVANEIYVGYTNNLRRRFKEHNAQGRTWQIAYYEAYRVKTDALLREKRLKYYGKALGQLKQRIKHSLDMDS